jgi:hypothetical protein
VARVAPLKATRAGLHSWLGEADLHFDLHCELKTAKFRLWHRNEMLYQTCTYARLWYAYARLLGLKIRRLTAIPVRVRARALGRPHQGKIEPRAVETAARRLHQSRDHVAGLVRSQLTPTQGSHL